uniref:RING-type domain-containing protein n=1 Tax=Wuchereria bancrofti TaxID=6293 RepID=A0AAF5PS72_WUCBA
MLNCPICLEADDGLFGFAALKCGHVFHRHCISSWLAIDKNTKICPVCRKFADSFLKLYFFSTFTQTSKYSESEKEVQKKAPKKRNKKKFSTHQQTTTHQYELRSISHISNTSNPYWLRIRRS